MGILPLQFFPGQDVERLHLSGEEIFAIRDAPGNSVVLEKPGRLSGNFAFLRSHN
jgi:hypothetical protein